MTKQLAVIATSALILLVASRVVPAQQAPTPTPGDMGEIVRLDPALDTVIAPGTTIEKVPGSWGTLPGARTEGPVWTRDGSLLFSETAGNVIYRLAANDKSSIYREHSGWVQDAPGGGVRPGSNGLALDREGRLLVCEMGNRRITRIENDGRVTVLADKFEGKRLNRPNDLVVKSDGSIYFTDTTASPASDSEIPHQSVFRIAPDGRLQLLLGDITPNGIAFSPDEKFLYVTNGLKWLRYEVKPDGTLGVGTVHIDLTSQRAVGPGGPDGMKVDAAGNLFATGPGGVWIISPEGKALGRIRLPVYAMNNAFGGNDGKTLYMTAWTNLYRLRVKTGGRLQLPLPGRAASGPAAARVNIPYVEAKSIFDELKEDLLPAALKGKTVAERERLWPEWVIERDRAIRARVAQGDEDSIYNFLLFGTSFTRQPRMTEVLDGLRNAGATETAAGVRELVQRRLDDLVTGLASLNDNERLQFVREAVERKGITPSTVEGRRQARVYLDDVIARVARERGAFNLAVASAMRAGDPVAKLEMQATLYRDRGLSTDTSIFPNFAIEQTLRAIHAARLLSNASVRRVAIVGPGLDFVDKEDGYDFYPLQSIQPLATIDSLLRLGLASPGDLRITTFDVSVRVNRHLETARQRAAAGFEYSLALARNLDRRWNPELLAYWKRIGDRIGKDTEGTSAPSNAGNVQVRSVTVRPEFAMSISPEDLDVVLQREARDPAERFDLIIATNVLVYYDVFEQSLALANIATMLRPGGLLLSNSLLHPLPSTPMELAGYTDARYADSNDGDRVFWYQRR